MNDTAVFTVIFPGNLKYFDAYLNSLRHQSERGFDVLLAVDAVPGIDAFLRPYEDSIRIVKRNFSGSIATIRMQAMEWLKGLSYDFFIFADSDDMLASDRVAVVRRELSRYAVVVNDVIPFSDESTENVRGFWKERLDDGTLFSAKDLVNFNFAGLGNSAVRKEVIRSIKVPENLQVVDWFFFFQWLQGLQGIFTHDGCTLYRQHNANLAGLRNVTFEKLLRIADVKIDHYTALRNEFPEMEKRLRRHQEMRTRLRTDDRLVSAVLEELNGKQINYFWWEETTYINE